MWGIQIPSGCIQTYLWGSHRSVLLIGHWELFGELRQFCNIKPCQIIKKMTKYRSLFLWLMEFFGEKLFPPSRGWFPPIFPHRVTSLTKKEQWHTYSRCFVLQCLPLFLPGSKGGFKQNPKQWISCPTQYYVTLPMDLRALLSESIQPTNWNRECKWNCVEPKSSWPFPAQWHSASDTVAMNLSFFIWWMEITYLLQSLLR